MDLASASLEEILQTRIEHDIDWTDEEILKIMKQVSYGIHTIKKFGICHRDIKPNNILYSLEDLTYKIADFGEAKRLNSVFIKNILFN